MPYKLRKAPNRQLYWVVSIETKKKHSKDPIPLAKAQEQMRILKQSLHGGMMKVGNPLAAATPEQDAKKVIQRILDSANSARAMSITIKEGHKSMEAIMNESALELSQARKAGAVQYLNQLREPYESRAEYKAEDSTARNKIAREMGLEVKGGSAKPCSCGPPYHDYSNGKASAFVLTCIDPRYTFDVAYYLQHKKELHQDYDLFTLAGASLGATKKEWKKTFFDHVDLGLKLHGIKEIWCFDHLDCGMYKATFGLEKDLDPKIHKTCMDKLKKVIKKKYPQLKFRKFLVDAKGHVKSMDKVY